MKEVKVINGYSKYTISSTGDVFSGFKGRVLRPNNNNGYRQVWLKGDDGISRWHYVHRLVASHFLEVPVSEKELWVNHEDGDKGNNDVSNLKWMTISENIIHSVVTGLRKSPRGAAHWNYGRKNTWSSGRKPMWRYVIPDVGVYLYSELKSVFGEKSISIIGLCKRNVHGYSRVSVNNG